MIGVLLTRGTSNLQQLQLDVNTFDVGFYGGVNRTCGSFPFSLSLSPLFPYGVFAIGQ